MSHLLSPKFLPTQSSQQMAAPGTAVWQQRNPGIEGGPGQGPGQPRYKCQSRGHPRPSCWRLSVSLWLQDCVPRATRASGIIDLECRASYIPRIKTVLSFPIETKRAKSVFMPFPSTRSFKWVLGQETSSRGCSLNKQTFPKFPSAIYIILFDCTLPTWPLHSFNGKLVCVPLLQVAGMSLLQVSKERRCNNFVFVYGRRAVRTSVLITAPLSPERSS